MIVELRFLKVDLSMADAVGKALWLPSIQTATPFQRKAEAQSIKNMTPSASGVYKVSTESFTLRRSTILPSSSNDESATVNRQWTRKISPGPSGT